MKKAYGFYKKKYPDGTKTQILHMGDGKTVISPLYSPDSQVVGLGFSYGVGNGKPGAKLIPDDGMLTRKDMTIQLAFDNVKSIDALIDQCKSLKKVLKREHKLQKRTQASEHFELLNLYLEQIYNGEKDD